LPDANGVLITRPEPGASDTAERITVLGLRPLVAPLLRVTILNPTIPASGRLQAIVAASGNAIAALPASHRHLPLFAVGDATALRAERAGFQHVTSAGGDAAALAALVARSCNPQAGALLLSTGRGQGAALVAELRRHGFGVLRRVTYAAEPVAELPSEARAALAAGALAAALFFSAETARTCVRLLRMEQLIDPVAAIDALAIGQPTAMALQPLPWRRIRVAAQPNQDAMLALLR
jgi:uroporphyrinogen-III synthase